MYSSNYDNYTNKYTNKYNKNIFNNNIVNMYGKSQVVFMFINL